MIFNHGAIVPYYPYWIAGNLGGRVKNPNFDRYSGLILDLKQNGVRVQLAKATFLPMLLAEIRDSAVQIVATVPGHEARSMSPALEDISRAIAARLRITARPDLLSRTRTIDKLAHGGNRSVQVHLSSMEVTDHLEIVGKSILLIDDVRTSGNSLEAGAALLLRAGAVAVHLLAIGQTTY